VGPWNEQQAYGVAGYGPFAPRVVNEPMAGWALGLSIFFLLCCAYGSPVALFLAVSAQRRIDASGGYLTGRGMATAALVISILGCAVLLLNLVLIVTGGGVGPFGL
jgi:hypothetical protein